MSDTQISVGMNVDGVVTGTDKAKRKISELGSAAREAGKGTGAIGDGMAGSASKVESATRNMVGSIQRQIAAMEAGDKTSRKYQESLARMRGIDVAALRPYLDQLDQVKAKQAAAAVSQENMTAGLGAIKYGALAAVAALGAFGAAFKNIVDGVDKLNDLKDATGASIENISALEDVALRTGTSFDTVGAALIKFNTTLKDSKAGSDSAAAFAAIGVSVADLKRLDPAEALLKVSKAFGNFADDGNKARIMQELFGKSTRDVAALLKDLSEKGALVGTVTTTQADEAERLNKEYFAMQKNITDIARDMAGPLVEAINTTIDKFRKAREEGKGFFTSLTANYWDNVRGVYGMGPASTGGATGSWEPEKPKMPDLPDPAVAKAAAAAAKKAQDEYNKTLAEQTKILAELSGYSADYESTVQRYVAMLKNGALNQGAFNSAVQELVAKQPGQIKLAKEQAEAQKILDKAIEETARQWAGYQEQQQKSIISADDEVAKAQEAYDAHSKLASVIQQEAVARLENARAQIIGTEDTSVLDAQIAAKRKLIDILSKGEMRDAGEKMAKDMAEEQKKAAEESGKYWEDALMRAFESGKGFFESLWSTIKNTLQTQVLKVLIAPVGGALSSVASAATASSDLISGAGSLASMGAQFGSAASITLSNGMISGFGANMANIAGQLASGSYTSALGMSLPYLGAAVAAFSALKSLGAFGSNFISATDSGRARVDYTSAGIGAAAYNTTGDALQTAAAQKSVETLAQSYFKTAAQLGINAMQATFEIGSNTGREGAAPQTVLGVNIGKAAYSSGEIASGDAAGLQLAASRAIITALKASELPAYLSKVFDDLTVSTATQDQISAALAYAGSLKTVRDALLETREPLQIVKDNVTNAFAALGTSAETFKADFVAAIDAGITGDALIAWQALGAGLDQVTASAKESARATAEWQTKLDIATGKTTQREVEKAAALATADTATAKLIKEFYALEDAAKAAEDVKTMNAAIADTSTVIRDFYTMLAEKTVALKQTLQGWKDTYAPPDPATLAERIAEGINNSGATENISATELLNMSVADLNAWAAEVSQLTVPETVTSGILNGDALRGAIANAVAGAYTANTAGFDASATTPGELAKLLAPSIAGALKAMGVDDATATGSATSVAGMLGSSFASTKAGWGASSGIDTVAEAATNWINQTLGGINDIALTETVLKPIFGTIQTDVDALIGQIQAKENYVAPVADSPSTLGIDKAASEKISLQNQLNELTDTSVQALKRQRDALDESNRALFDQVQGFKTLKGLQSQYAAPETLDQAREKVSAAGLKVTGLDTAGIASYISELLSGPEMLNSLGELTTTGLATVTTIDGVTSSLTLLGNAADASIATQAGLTDQISVLNGTYTQTEVERANVLKALTKAGDTASIALQKTAWSLEDTATAAQVTKDYDRALLEAAGNTSALAAFDKAISDAALITAGWTQAQIDAVAATKDRTKLANATKDYDRALLVATGDDAGLKAFDRAIETSARLLAGWTPAQIAAVNAATDAAASASAAVVDVSSALDSYKSATDAAYSALQSAVDAQKSVVQETISNISAIIDSIDSAVRSIRGEADSAGTFDRAQSFLDNALSNAQASGYLPDSKELSSAIADLTSGLSSQIYASESDKQFQALAVAGKLDALGGLAKPQLSAAQQQLKVLDDTLTTAKNQIDELRGINDSVLGIGGAISRLAAAIDAEKAGGAALATSTQTSLRPINPIVTANIKDYQDYSTASYAVIAAGGPDAVRARILAMYDGRFSEPLDTVQQLATAAKIAGMRGFKIGTNYVTSDGPAYLHEGEAVIPKAYNPAAGGQQNNARMESLIEGLTKEVQRLQSIVNDGNRHAERTADATNGRPEQPMLVETV